MGKICTHMETTNKAVGIFSIINGIFGALPCLCTYSGVLHAALPRITTTKIQFIILVLQNIPREFSILFGN